jgi:hypothetical protein
LRVLPGARRSELVGRHGTGWKVRVAAPPERGKANDAALDLVAGALGVPRASVDVAAGGGSRDKIVTVLGLSPREVDDRLEARAAAKVVRGSAR